MNLEKCNFPEDLKDMPLNELENLASEIRKMLLSTISKTGGHLASNLGVVELTIALHKVLDLPKDKIVWDVGHQSYVHKILSGRMKDFKNIRQLHGISGFPKCSESEYDIFDTGHSSNSISIATGLAVGRDLQNEDFNVVAVIGDGALTGGLAYEGLNNLGSLKKRVIVILNDNGMSIGKNTGSMSQHLSSLRTSKRYLGIKSSLKTTLKSIPLIGNGIFKTLDNMKETIKGFILDEVMFEELGFTYLGPVDGNNLDEVIKNINMAKNLNEPVLLHVITKKGLGYKEAEENPHLFHGVGPFDPITGKTKPSEGKGFSQVFGEKLTQMAEADEKIVAISAAMIDGVGLSDFEETFPNRTFDVGIAEGHAVSFAGGLAKIGMKPIVSVYSTFLQRGYDQMITDVCLQDLPVVFAIDRAGCVGNDGETHHGIYDISYLSHIPNMTIFAPANGKELEKNLEEAFALGKPCAIRYPRGKDKNIDTINLPKGRDIEILAVGTMLEPCIEAANILKENGIKAGVTYVNKIKPINTGDFDKDLHKKKHIFTVEDNVITGGFGESFTASFVNEKCKTKIYNLGWPDKFIEHGTQDQLYQIYQLNGEGIARTIKERLDK